MVQPERITDREHLLPHHERARAPDEDWSYLALQVLKLEHRHVLVFVEANDFCGVSLLVRERNAQVNRAFNHVKVGHYMPVVIPDESRSCSSGHRLHVQGKLVSHLPKVGDVHHRWRVRAKNLSRPDLLRREHGFRSSGEGVRRGRRREERDRRCSRHPYTQSPPERLLTRVRFALSRLSRGRSRFRRVRGRCRFRPSAAVRRERIPSGQHTPLLPRDKRETLFGAY
mmetsp:Transcript_13439/g.44272  ORF Transcript_13439/g.44272 Transcript_13439/m.44272 type:complete len:227 (-) Transcript_13439:50-730(-)